MKHAYVVLKRITAKMRTIHSSVFPMQQTEDIFLPEAPQDPVDVALFPVLISCQAGENVF